MLESAGLVDAVEKDRQVAPTLPAKRVKNSFTCEICFDDDPDMETTALSCEHRFCNTCYEHYLRQKIIEEGECRNIQCPQDKCNRIVDEKTVSLLVDDKVKSRYDIKELRNNDCGIHHTHVIFILDTQNCLIVPLWMTMMPCDGALPLIANMPLNAIYPACP